MSAQKQSSNNSSLKRPFWFTLYRRQLWLWLGSVDRLIWSNFVLQIWQSDGRRKLQIHFKKKKQNYVFNFQFFPLFTLLPCSSIQAFNVSEARWLKFHLIFPKKVFHIFVPTYLGWRKRQSLIIIHLSSHGRRIRVEEPEKNEERLNFHGKMVT